MNELSEAREAFIGYPVDKEAEDMKYLKIFTDFLEVMDPLTNEEAGRLYRAMLAYAKDGSEPELSGNERFLWTVAKQHINREVAAYKTKVEADSKNGRKGAAIRWQKIAKDGDPHFENGENSQDNDNEKTMTNTNTMTMSVCVGTSPPCRRLSPPPARSSRLPL